MAALSSPVAEASGVTSGISWQKSSAIHLPGDDCHGQSSRAQSSSYVPFVCNKPCPDSTNATHEGRHDEASPHSGGVSNSSIRDALVDMLGKPIGDSTALCIPTAMYGMYPRTAVMTWRQIAGQSPTPLVELGWKSVGMLELTALPSIDKEKWVPLVSETDALLVCGGDVLYLHHWMRESGLADLFPSLSKTVYVGLSAGSMVMSPHVGEEFVGWKPDFGGDSALGMVGFSIFPHLDNPMCPENSMADAEQWAARVPVPGYALDDETAIKVVDGAIDVISEGHWKLFER